MKFRPILHPPVSIEQLMERVYQIAGHSIQQIAHSCHQPVPSDLMHNKGYVGQLIEMVLGAQSGSLAQPDFPELGVELKTLPINRLGKPKESTYISVAPLLDLAGVSYQNSGVGKKLEHVLWIPVEAEKDIVLADRKVGQGFLWQPNPQQKRQLERDFNEIIELIALGEVETITAHQGEVLQLRPKAANSKALTQARGPDGDNIMTLPRGFYLRPGFTRKLLNSFVHQEDSEDC